MADDFMTPGMQAYKDGEREKAQAFFIQATQQNPQSETAWLWLGHCLTEIERRRYCYQKVLALNPANNEARDELWRLDELPGPVSPFKEPVPEATESPTQESESEEEPKQPQKIVQKRGWETNSPAEPVIKRETERRLVQEPVPDNTSWLQRDAGSGKKTPHRRKGKRNWRWVPAVLGWLTVPLLCLLLVAGCVAGGLISIPQIPWPAPTPTVASQTLIYQAEDALQAENYQQAIDLLEPVIVNWTNPDDLLVAYRILGDAEAGLKNYAAAAVYCEKRYALQPTAENLFVLAVVYDLGGNTLKAIETYQKLWALGSQAGSRIDLNFVRTRLQHLGESLGTQLPPATPTPTPKK